MPRVVRMTSPWTPLLINTNFRSGETMRRQNLIRHINNKHRQGA